MLMIKLNKGKSINLKNMITWQVKDWAGLPPNGNIPMSLLGQYHFPPNLLPLYSNNALKLQED